MEYDDPQAPVRIAEQMRAFVDNEVLPVEREHLRAGEPIPAETLLDLREEARTRDLYAPQVDSEEVEHLVRFGE